jgi:hypothetical protein
VIYLRIELHEVLGQAPNSKTYDLLHEVLGRCGYLRVVEDKAGKRFQLPTGLYANPAVSDASTAVTTGDQAARTVWPDVSIVAISAADSWFRLRPAPLQIFPLPTV